MGNECCSKKTKDKVTKKNKKRNLKEEENKNKEERTYIGNDKNVKNIEKEAFGRGIEDKRTNDEQDQIILPKKLLKSVDKDKIQNMEGGSKNTSAAKSGPNLLGGSSNCLEGSLNSYLCVVKTKKEVSTECPTDDNWKFNSDSNTKLRLNASGNVSGNGRSNGSSNGSKVLYSKNEFIKGKLIGTGRFGSVYSGLSANTGEIIAMKIFKLEDQEIFYNKQLEEAYDKLKTLHHSNLINCVPVCKKNNEHDFCIIYEFCNGSSVKTLLDKYGEFDEKLIKKYVKQILTGLKYLHDQNIIHKNLKSSNILVDGNGTIRVSDILLEEVLMDRGEPFIEKLKSSLEIPYWISPDLINSENKDNNGNIDFWSLGCLIIEMATRKSPWHHYSFKSSEEFINFLSKTNLVPPFPKKLSTVCYSFLNLLFRRFNRNSDSNILKSMRQSESNFIVTVEDLLQHEFFSTNPLLDSANRESNQNAMKISSENTNSESHSIKENNMLNVMTPLKNNNNIVNIFNNDNGNGNGDMFSMTMTVNGSSQCQSLVNNNLLSALQNEQNFSYLQSQPNIPFVNNNKKLLITNNILEEIDPSKENSPNIKNGGEKNYFDFNDNSSENSYNYVHEANKSIIRQSNMVQNDSLPIGNFLSKFNPLDKFHNVDFGDALSVLREKISSIRPEGGNNNLMSSVNNLSPSKIEQVDREYVTTEENCNVESIIVENGNTIEKISLMKTVSAYKKKQNTFDTRLRMKLTNLKEGELPDKVFDVYKSEILR